MRGGNFNYKVTPYAIPFGAYGPIWAQKGYSIRSNLFKITSSHYTLFGAKSGPFGPKKGIVRGGFWGP